MKVEIYKSDCHFIKGLIQDFFKRILRNTVCVCVKTNPLSLVNHLRVYCLVHGWILLRIAQLGLSCSDDHNEMVKE